jgi:methoxymalonate biosynthesis protein
VTIKCVVWDIDNTLLDGTYLEAGSELPGPDTELVAAGRELAGRGILHALASRNPVAAADYVREVTGLDFAAVECGWGSKAEAISRIATELGLAPDALAFVDDDLVERAEVAAMLPGVLVLTPEDAAEAPDWPQFSPAVITAEGRRRGQLYAERSRRQSAARAFGGSRDEFLRQAGTRVTIGLARPQDLPRLHELSVRTHQLNSAGQPVPEAELAGLLSAPAQLVVTVTLADNFGDDGLVGAAIMTGNGAGPRSVPLVMMSCRALGRGALDALLAWLCQSAAAAGASELRVPCLVTERNVPMRLALAAAGLRAEPESVSADGRAVFARSLAGPLPDLPDWAGQSEQAIAAELRAILAQLTGRDELLAIPPQTPLFGAGVGLDSLAGTLLLRQVQRRYGVDVAAEDLNLDSLETLGTLAAFIAASTMP